MSLEDSNGELLQFKSYEININNPVAINRKKSEREKKINPQIVNDEKSKKEIILPEEQNQPINNYPYEFYEETQSKKEIIKNENENPKEEKKEEISKQQPEKIIEKPKIEEKTTEQKVVEQTGQKKDEKILKKEEQKIQKKEEPKKEEKKNIENDDKKKIEQKKEDKKKEEQNKNIKKKDESKKEEKKNIELQKEVPKKEEKKNIELQKEESKKNEKKNIEVQKEEPKKIEQKIEKPKNVEAKKEVKKEIKKEAEVTNSLKEKLTNPTKKEDKRIERPKKEETKPQKQIANESKKMVKPNPKIQNEIKGKINEKKNETLKATPPKIEEKKKEEPKINQEPQKNNEKQINDPNNEVKEIEEVKKEKVLYKGLENRAGGNNISPPPLREMKDSNKIAKLETKEQLPKTLLTKKTEDNYDLLIKYFKDEYYKRGDDVIIDGIINYNDFSSDKFLGLASEKIKIDNNNKSIVDSFLQRNKEEIKQRQDNNKTIDNRIKLIDESTKKKLYFNDKKSQQEYFDSFYNKQMEYKNNCIQHINKLTNKFDEERKKICAPEPKNKKNLDYFKNNEPVRISKYSFKAKNSGNINNNENNLKEKVNEDKNKSVNKEPTKFRFKKMQSFDPNPNDNSYNNNNNNDNAQDNSRNEDNNCNNKSKNESKTLKKIKSGSLLTKKEKKLTKKEMEEITNKLHYDGELLKIKKKNSNEESINNSYNNYSSEKLTHSSIIILIKKLLFEYCTSIMKSAYSDYMQNPKINYEQYIDVLKDLYYLEKDALPEDYLEEDSMYKELWNKLIQFSTAPVNSIESNVLLLYILELNGFFSNDKILKELENELYWIKLQEYDDLIANAKYIEENWDDLKKIKIDIIKRLKLEGKYSPIHYEALYSDNSVISGNIINSNLNVSSILNNDNTSTNHYLTTLKGNTNYHFIHGYNSNKKGNENSILRFSKNLSDKNEENKHCSFSISNLSNKNIKNRVPLKDSYKDLVEKKKSQIENMKKDKEEKLKEICTFKPQINTVNKKIFSKEIKIELPKYKLNKSMNLYHNSITQENNKNSGNNIFNQNQNAIIVDNQTKNNNTNGIINDKKSTNKKALKRNKSSLQKMFKDNPLKEDKSLNEKIEKLKMTKFKEMEKYNFPPPMRFDIEYPSKFESIGININREENMKQRTHNVIFYNIKVNEKIKTLKYIEGDDLKLTVINFVNKNKLPEEVTDIILTKIKEKTNEEAF